MNPVEWVLAALVMFFGSAVQGAVGFGVNLVAAPLLILLDPELVPAPMIIAALVLNLLVIRRERGGSHWREVRWPILAAIPGSFAGAALVAAFGSTDLLTVFFGVLILVAVGLSASGLHLRRTPAALTGAGVASGFMGTAVGIGGPPMALLYTRASGPEIRGALSRFFGAAAVLSLTTLTLLGQCQLADVGRALVLVPGTVLGYLASGWLAPRVNHAHVRFAVLTLSGASAVVAIGRALLT